MQVAPVVRRACPRDVKPGIRGALQNTDAAEIGVFHGRGDRQRRSSSARSDKPRAKGRPAGQGGAEREPGARFRRDPPGCGLRRSARMRP